MNSEAINRLNMPAANHPASNQFDLNHLSQVIDRANSHKLKSFREAIDEAEALMKADPAYRSVTVFCLRANGELWLVTVKAASWKKIWNFGVLQYEETKGEVKP